MCGQLEEINTSHKVLKLTKPSAKNASMVSYNLIFSLVLCTNFLRITHLCGSERALFSAKCVIGATLTEYLFS